MTLTEIRENDLIFYFESGNTTTLPLGKESLSNQFFTAYPPSYEELENAINFVEDELAKVHHQFLEANVLELKGEHALSIAKLAFNVKETDRFFIVPRVEIEMVFNRMAEIVKGLPASQDELPDSTEFAAYLLVVREMIHHLYIDHFMILKS